MTTLRREDFFDYQQRAYDFAMEKRKCAWWIDMGLGKTAPALTVAKDLLDDFAVAKVLVIAPKRVADNTWPDEIKEWEHLKGLRVSLCSGGQKNALRGLARDAHIYTINVENVDWLVNHYKNKWPFDMVIIDESSKFKTPSSQRFRALKKLVKRGLIHYMIQLTGTPASNGLLDVWGPSYLLDGGKALGTSMTEYKKQYFDEDFLGYSYTVKPGCEQRIYEMLSNNVLVIKNQNEEGTIRYNNIAIQLSPKAQEMYETLTHDFIVQIAGGEEIVAVNSAVLNSKLQQLASGSVYLQDEDGNREAKFLHSEKLDVLQSIVDENPGQPLLVGYAFKHELEAIRKKFPKAVTMDDGPDVIQRWNEGKIEMLVGHPASMGHGLNLQKGPGHTAVWYGLSWSLELYQQFNKRLARTGQKNTVTIHHIVCKNTVDEAILAALRSKDATQEKLTAAVRQLVDKTLQKKG